MKNILIFEPWNLGDVVIAANFARYIYENFGSKISFVCQSQWAEWLSSQYFINKVFTFEAPWVKIRGKYNPFNYDLTKILMLKKFLNNINNELIWDVRGDIRHKLFLNILTTKKVISIKYPPNINIYDRVLYFTSKIFNDNKINSFNSIAFIESNKNKCISVFLDSYWPNKKVPNQKSYELIRSLLINNYIVKLIIPPKIEYNFTGKISQEFPNNFQIVKGNVFDVVEVLKNSDMVISTDSGWMHMAYYYKIPCIALFGFDNHQEWAPPNTKIVLAKKFLPKNERYKLRNLNISPLETLDINEVLNEIKILQEI